MIIDFQEPTICIGAYYIPNNPVFPHQNQNTTNSVIELISILGTNSQTNTTIYGNVDDNDNIRL
jgi:hypothetical protein